MPFSLGPGGVHLLLHWLRKKAKLTLRVLKFYKYILSNPGSAMAYNADPKGFLQTYATAFIENEKK
jgi:hypothetical protein